MVLPPRTGYAGGKLIYLPPYSPDLNPIEQFFSKLKADLRKVAARTVRALHHALATVITACQPGECANYLANAGYMPPNRETL